MLVAVNQSLNSEASMHLFITVVVCVAVVAICGCDRSQPTPPVTSNPTQPVGTSPTPPATTNPTPVELPESANSIGMKFKLIPAWQVGGAASGERSPEAEARREQGGAATEVP